MTDYEPQLHYNQQKRWYKSMYLKKIVKENHGHKILKICFNPHHPNLIATVGGTEANIYDNENCGEHLDLALNFVNLPTPALLNSYYLRSHYENLKTKPQDVLTLSEQECILDGYDEDIFVGEIRRETELKEELPANKSHSAVVAEVTVASNPIFSSATRIILDATWVSFPKPIESMGKIVLDYQGIDENDTWLAICGQDGFVQLISVAYAKVLYVLHGHYESVKQMATWHNNTKLASISENSIILWDINSIAIHYYSTHYYGSFGARIKDFCFQKIPIDPGSVNSISFCSYGLVCGGIKGKLRLYPWIISPLGETMLSVDQIHLDWPYNSSINQLLSFRPRNNCLLAGSDNLIVHFSLGTNDEIYEFLTLPSTLSLSIIKVIKQKKVQYDPECKFDVSMDGEILIVGNKIGNTILYNLHSGLLIHTLDHPRLKRSVICCTVSHHSKNVIAASDSILWRWDYIPKEIIAETKEKMKRLKRKRKSRSKKNG